MFINDCILWDNEVQDVSLESDSDSESEYKEEYKEEEVNDNIYNIFINDCILLDDELPDVSLDSDSDSDDKEEVDDNILLYFIKKIIVSVFRGEEYL